MKGGADLLLAKELFSNWAGAEKRERKEVCAALGGFGERIVDPVRSVGTRIRGTEKCLHSSRGRVVIECRCEGRGDRRTGAFVEEERRRLRFLYSKRSSGREGGKSGIRR